MTYRRIQDQDVKGSADVSVDSDLIHDDKIYVDSLSKRLDEATPDRDLYSSISHITPLCM